MQPLPEGGDQSLPVCPQSKVLSNAIYNSPELPHLQWEVTRCRNQSIRNEREMSSIYGLIHSNYCFFPHCYLQRTRIRFLGRSQNKSRVSSHTGKPTGILHKCTGLQIRKPTGRKERSSNREQGEVTLATQGKGTWQNYCVLALLYLGDDRFALAASKEDKQTRNVLKEVKAFIERHNAELAPLIPKTLQVIS